MPETLFYDDTNYNIPAGDRAAVYLNGEFAVTPAIARRYPRRFYIGVKSGQPEQAREARSLDVERFDADIPDARPFTIERLQFRRDPTIYCSLDTVPAIAAALEGLYWRLWLALFDDVTTRPPLPDLGHGELWAKQFRKGTGGAPDVSVLYGADLMPRAA
jgi:hypothetical protein